MGAFYRTIKQDYAKALECREDSIEICRKIDDQLLMSDNLDDIGAIHGVNLPKLVPMGSGITQGF